MSHQRILQITLSKKVVMLSYLICLLMHYISTMPKGQVWYRFSIMLVSQSIFTPLSNGQVTFHAHCALKDDSLKNNKTEATLHFSKFKIGQWKWLMYFKLWTDQVLPLDRGLCQGVAFCSDQNLIKSINFSFISVQQTWKCNATLCSGCKIHFTQERCKEGVSTRNWMVSFV